MLPEDYAQPGAANGIKFPALYSLDAHRYSHTTADTKGCKSPFGLAALHLIKKGG